MDSQRTGKQNALRIVSIIYIVLALIAIVVSVAFMAVMGAAAGTDVDITTTIGGESVSSAGLLMVMMGLVLIGAIFDLIIGVCGLRGANNPQKIGPFRTLCIICVIYYICALIFSVMNGDTSTAASHAVQLIVCLILLWIANGIRSQAR